MGALIDAKMQRLLREGHDEVSIIGEMFDCMPFFKMLLDSGRTLWMSCAGALPDSIITQRSLKHWQLASSQGRFKCPSKSVTIFHVNSGRSQLSCSASAGLLKEFALVRLTALHFRLERRPCFHYINGIHEQASSRQKASGQDTNGKKANPRQEDSP